MKAKVLKRKRRSHSQSKGDKRGSSESDYTRDKKQRLKKKARVSGQSESSYPNPGKIVKSVDILAIFSTSAAISGSVI